MTGDDWMFVCLFVEIVYFVKRFVWAKTDMDKVTRVVDKLIDSASMNLIHILL